MFSSLRDRYEGFRERFGSAGLVVAVIAMIAALGGSAIAAKGALTAKQKKEVTKIAKKFAGKTGAPGAQGPAGTNGTNGKDGAPGKDGAAGEDGIDGKSVEVDEIEVGAFGCEERGGVEVKEEGAVSGEEICNGKPGEPWSAGGTLPSEATLTGAWSTLLTSTPAALVPVTFDIPLDQSACTVAEPDKGCLPAGSVHKTGDANFGEFCEGTAEDPQADPGHLCVYTAKIEGPGAAIQIIVPAGTSGVSGGTGGASTAGAALFIEGAPNTIIRGTYAVTAP